MNIELILPLKVDILCLKLKAYLIWFLHNRSGFVNVQKTKLFEIGITTTKFFLQMLLYTYQHPRLFIVYTNWYWRLKKIHCWLFWASRNVQCIVTNVQLWWKLQRPPRLWVLFPESLNLGYCSLLKKKS